ncbi:MAG TPA: molybdopterin molybdotransferase MoeA [Aggregatilineales bacterium]|nr:molybdopterin molybdotransferase MoeA [Anaerolineales bacterium]HRE49194.1 molybdopterin molybdotransferase MoeA [Aggregatilineales bacterium]
MYSVEQALAHILAALTPLPAETLPLAGAHIGRILAADIGSDDDLPPFDNSSMDGYALIAADTADAGRETPVTLRVAADIPAGTYSERRIGRGEAARIMTGAPLPPGADAVIPVEETDTPPAQHAPIGEPPPETVQIYSKADAGAYVRRRGEDMRAGQIVLRAGRRLRPADIGALAGMGAAAVPLVRQPRVAILSTGDELLTPDQPLTPGKIRDMNGYALAAAVIALGGVALQLPIARDTVAAVRARLEDARAAYADLILSSAGVSVGAFDAVKTAVEADGTLNFWKVNIRPGKPLAFGLVGGVPFFGLPGNPVSALVTFDVFVRPALLMMMGLPAETGMSEAELGERMTSDGRRTYARVRLERREGRLVAYSTGSQSSGVITSLVAADGLLVLPEGVTDAPVGAVFPVRLFDAG